MGIILTNEETEDRVGGCPRCITGFNADGAEEAIDLIGHAEYSRLIRRDKRAEVVDVCEFGNNGPEGGDLRINGGAAVKRSELSVVVDRKRMARLWVHP